MKRAFCIILTILITAVAFAGCSLFGEQKSGLELDQTALNMTVGETAQLNAGEATKVKWTSSDESVASVHAGSVVAKKAGTADITASLEDGTSEVCKVTVADKLITSVTLSSKSIKLGLGKTVQISASYAPADASVTELTWSSENEKIATVNNDGYITGCSDGTTNIVCTSSGGVSASCVVTVAEAPEAPTKPPATTKPTSSTEPTASTQATEAKSETRAPAAYGDYIFPDSSTRMLSDSEVKEKLGSMTGVSVSGSFSQDAVNEIFARNGYVFRTASIKAYYESKSWYKPDPNFSMSELSEIEEYNIALFSKY